MALKKVPSASVEEKRRLIDPEYAMIPFYRQCELLDITRSSYYYQSERDDRYNLVLRNRIDEQFTKTPFYGVPRMTAWLNLQGYPINPKRVRRLMRAMGLEAVYPEPRLSQSHAEHKKYTYLLKDLVIDRPDQVWFSDTTFIRMVHGFVDLMAVMNWFSWYVLAWQISIT